MRPPSRNIKTSPALFTLERVMKSFRARSQLLVSRLEDSDEVLHLEFSDEAGEASPDSDEDGYVSRLLTTHDFLNMQTIYKDMSIFFCYSGFGFYESLNRYIVCKKSSKSAEFGVKSADFPGY